jgi:N-acetylneuraminic acid mutarotase
MMSIDLGKLLRSAAACSVALGALTATAHAQSAGSWVTKAPVPAALNEVTVAYAGGKIHVLGGSVLGFTGPYHQEYDPATDKWRARAPLPRALDHIGSAVLNGKVYAVGGFVGGGVHRDGQNTAFEYDPSLDTWRILAPLKAGRGSVGVVALDGKIHAIGGRAPDGTTVATHEVYDPATNTWKELAPLPKARDHAAAAAIDGKIHIAGPRPTPGRRARRCRRRAAASRARSTKACSWCSAASCRPVIPFPRMRPMIPRPTHGARLRRCRAAGTRPPPLQMAITSTSPPAP